MSTPKTNAKPPLKAKYIEKIQRQVLRNAADPKWPNYDIDGDVIPEGLYILEEIRVLTPFNKSA